MPFWRKESTLISLWLIVALIAAVKKLPAPNNYKVFCGMFHHTAKQLPLYVHYPDEYHDLSLYGPIFSIVIAPFALMPDWLGLLLWDVALALLLFWAVRTFCINTNVPPTTISLHSHSTSTPFIIWFCAHELLIALFMQQYNVAIAAGLIMTYYCVEKEKDFWAAFWIILGTFVKLYGIVGIAFFLFSKHKWRFTLSCLFWAVVMFVLPMLISSPEYIVNEYGEWYKCLIEKNNHNVVGWGEGIRRNMQNISLLGIVRRITLVATYSDLWLIIPGVLLFCAPYLRIKQWQSMEFRQTFLASAMMFLCLFSSGTESSGYITALIGCCIWYKCVPWERSKADLWLMVFAFILTSLSMSDLFPHYIRDEWVKPLALKALPVSVIWFKLSYELLTKDYSAFNLQQRNL